MDEIAEFQGAQEIEARDQNIGVSRAVIISNGVASDEEQSCSLIRALGLTLHGRLHVQRPSKRPRLWFIRWLPRFIYNKFPDFMGWFRRSNSLPISTQHVSTHQAGSSGYKEFTDANEVVKTAQDGFEDLGPLLVIGSGRDTVAVTSFIRKSAPAQVFAVQIQYPECDFKMFDFVILPDHEYYLHCWFPRRWARKPGNNVHLTVGVMHKADLISLGRAASTLKNQLGALAPPLLVVNIGEPTKNCPYTEDVIGQLSRDLLRVYHSCGSIRIYISRTAPQKFFEILARDFKDDDKLQIWNGQDPDPYLAYLHEAYAIVVTADSVSMLSHACSTRKPVYVVGDESCTSWLKEFLKQLKNQGAVKRFSECQNISDTWNYPPLQDARNAATVVHRAYSERRW